MSNRERWRRLLIGVVCIVCVLSGAVYDAIRSRSTATSAGPARQERVWFLPGQADAAANQPLHLEVAVSPSTPRVGEPVTFSVTGSDPDGPLFGGDVLWGFGDGGGGTGATVAEGCRLSDPSPVPSPGAWTRTYTHTYRHRGTFRVFFVQTSASMPAGCRSADPWANTGKAEATVAVTQP